MTTTPNEPVAGTAGDSVADADIETDPGQTATPMPGGGTDGGDADGTDGGDSDGTDGGDSTDSTDGGDADGTDA